MNNSQVPSINPRHCRPETPLPPTPPAPETAEADGHKGTTEERSEPGIGGTTNSHTL